MPCNVQFSELWSTLVPNPAAINALSFNRDQVLFLLGVIEPLHDARILALSNTHIMDGISSLASVKLGPPNSIIKVCCKAALFTDKGELHTHKFLTTSTSGLTDTMYMLCMKLHQSILVQGALHSFTGVVSRNRCNSSAMNCI